MQLQNFVGKIFIFKSGQNWMEAFCDFPDVCWKLLPYNNLPNKVFACICIHKSHHHYKIFNLKKDALKYLPINIENTILWCRWMNYIKMLGRMFVEPKVVLVANFFYSAYSNSVFSFGIFLKNGKFFVDVTHKICTIIDVVIDKYRNLDLIGI